MQRFGWTFLAAEREILKVKFYCRLIPRGKGKQELAQGGLELRGEVRYEAMAVIACCGAVAVHAGRTRRLNTFEKEEGQ